MDARRRHAFAALGLAVTMLALGLLRPDAERRMELAAERAGRDLAAALGGGLGGRPVEVTGPEACRRGAAAGLRRALGDRRVDADAEPIVVTCRVGEGDLVLDAPEAGRGLSARAPLPGWTSVLPPILAVFIALATRRLVLALASAVWIGALLAFGPDITLGLWPALRELFWPAVSDRFRLTIVVFVTALVGMVNVVTRAGGSQGIADAIGRVAKEARSTRIATVLLGLAIFFDDYSNCIVVGTTMRPISDRLRISREKLAYLVDSTAAPVAGVALLSTWIGYEVSLFEDLSSDLGLGASGYDIFLRVLPARFYCYLALGFVLAVAALGRDFGPMLRAERRALVEGKVLSDEARPLSARSLSRVLPAAGVVPRWAVAVVPIAVVIALTFLGLVWTGGRRPEVVAWAAENGASGVDLGYVLRCVRVADAAFVLMIAALTGSAVAWGLALTRRSREGGAAKGDARLATPWGVALGAAMPLAVLAGALVVQGGPSAFRLAALDEPEVRAVLALAGALSVALAGIGAVRWIAERRARRPVFALRQGDVYLSWVAGLRAMLLAVSILVLAWTIQRTCQTLGTSIFLVAALHGALTPELLPLLVFLLAAAVAFSTGTSWGSMGILCPAVLPLAHELGGMPLLLLSAGAVLDGSIFGDHCSPISDTTVISSAATGCDHVDHVKTQIPYALTCMVVAGLCYLAAGGGVPAPCALVAGLVVLLGLLVIVGRGAGRASARGGGGASGR